MDPFEKRKTLPVGGQSPTDNRKIGLEKRQMPPERRMRRLKTRKTDINGSYKRRVHYTVIISSY
jgi:hypothetical protein